MDRIIVTPGQIPLDTDLLNTNKNVMLALGRAFAAIFGTGNIANGLAVTPAATGLNVLVAPGSIYSLQDIDLTPYGSLPADTTDTVVKQGINPSVFQLPCPAPTTAGFSINYLIEAEYQDVDGDPLLLPFYNAQNPAQPFSGPGGDGALVNTIRQGQVGLIAKAGIAAATGSQITPSADPGFIPLAVVTVANGQTNIVAGNITASTQSVIANSLLQSIQSGNMTFGADVGAVNACVVNLSPAPTAITDGMVVSFIVADANTGATTLNLSGAGAFPILTAGFAALSGGEFTAGSRASVQWDAALNSWVLLNAVGGIQRGVTPPNGDNSTRLATTAFATSVVPSSIRSAAASSLIGNPTGAAAAPSAITLANGLAFNGATLGLGNITPTTVAASGNVKGASFGPITGSLPSVAAQGAYIGWNGGFGGLSGETDFINNLGEGSGGWAWVAENAAGTTPVVAMGLSDNGNLFNVNSISMNGATSMSMSEGLINAVTLVASTEVVTPVIDAPSTTLVLGTTGAGTFFLRPNGASSTSNQGTYASTGNLTIAGTLSQGSDVTVKTNIVKLKNCLDFVEHYLVGVEYDRTDKVSHDRGFISQEVEKGEPGLIEHVENGDIKDFKNLKYIETIPYLANAITELSAIVREQAAEVAGLKGARPTV